MTRERKAMRHKGRSLAEEFAQGLKDLEALKEPV